MERFKAITASEQQGDSAKPIDAHFEAKKRGAHGPPRESEIFNDASHFQSSRYSRKGFGCFSARF
jgi:hypothetical protein